MERVERAERKSRYFDYSLLVIILFLVCFGLVMVYSTSSYSASVKLGDSSYYFRKQATSTIAGLAALAFFTLVDYHLLYKFATPIYITAVLCVVLVVTPLGITLNGARRWIGIGPLSFQPAELVKLALIIAFAAFICYSGKKIKSFRNMLACLILGVVPTILILGITSNLSSAIIVFGIACIMFFVAHPKTTPFVVIVLIVAGLVGAFLFYFFNHIDDHSGLGFRFQRLLAWRNPENYASGYGYQTLQSLYALGSGGIFGKGLGQSLQKLGFIPEAQNDMIFSIVCEELGLFGGICIIMLFVLMIWRFMIIANNAPDLFGSMLVVGVMAHIAIQVILNVAVVTNTIPNTGISLPFISYGGTSVLFLLSEMGIVLNVSRNIRIPK